MVTFRFHQYQVVGRAHPTESDGHPKIYRMKLWATNDVRAKSKFWYFLRKLKKVKKSNDQVLAINEVYLPFIIYSVLTDLLLGCFVENYCWSHCFEGRSRCRCTISDGKRGRGTGCSGCISCLGFNGCMWSTALREDQGAVASSPMESVGMALGVPVALVALASMAACFF
ncbi:uncharacterized protein LOC120172941 [Hibiscus syriacus]|uniref:uncharacterized protein LOC120172941 n=1 Tax=Hibiscus syriacus TaxID=106335 RepID=UPI0019231C63|nr:uncharacterized protein LOC120172941 [Hibiscus syriacus]